MGQSISPSQLSQNIPQAITKNFSFKNHTDYQFVKQIHRNNVPTNNIFQFKSKKDNKFYTFRIIIVSADDQVVGLQNIIQKRKKIKSLHLCQLKLSINQQQTMTCATIHKLGLLMQCPPKSLKQQFQQRKITMKQRKGRFFKESQLWAITYSVVHGLKQLNSHGIHHQSLDLQQIYIDTNGLIKLGDPILFGLQKNYIAALRQKQFCARKLSPQLINFLQECNFFFYDKQKSDIFIFGLILLEITLLKQIIVYNHATKQRKLEVLNSYLFEVKNRYSQKYHRLLCWMLQVQPKNRPNLSDLGQFIQTNNVQSCSSNQQSKQISSNYISPIASQIQFKQLPIFSESALQNRMNKQVFNSLNNPKFKNQQHYQKNNNFQTPQTNSFFNSPIKQTKQATVFNNAKTPTEQNQDVIFPFQLVYNRIVNNNENLKPFELPKLYQQYKVQMFNSSCRGSVPSSSFHSKNLQKSNQNMKLRDIQTFSQNHNHQTNNVIKNFKYLPNDFKNSQHQYFYQAHERQDTNLIYSNSSGLNATNRIFSSTKTLGDIKLIQSNHYINDYQAEIKNNKPVLMQGIIEQSIASSPYRKLNSLKSKSIFQNQSGNNTIFSSLKLPEFENKSQDKRIGQQNLDLHYNYKQYHSNLKQKNKQKVLQELQLQYHSMETKVNFDENFNMETFKSQFLLKGTKNQQKNDINRQMKQSVKIYKQEKFFQIKKERFSRFQKFNMLNFKDEVITSKNQLLDQSQMNSKLSVFTPNFYQKEKSKNSSDFLQNSKKQELQYVQKQMSSEGNIYTGFKTTSGLKQGQGRLDFHDGGYYEGQWKNNQMNGYGEMFYQNGQIAYKGSWKNDHFCGSGKVHNDRPQYFTGQFNFRDFSQIGQKWLSYQGEFDSDSKHGKGRIDLTNGEYFQGTFDYDMIEGYGTYYTKDENKVIRGVWRDNQLIQTI